MFFHSEMEQAATKKESNIVLALDFPFRKPGDVGSLFSKAEDVLDMVHSYICAVKFNHHLVLPLGTFNGVTELVRKAHEMGLMAIMDCKVNDIGATNRVIAAYYYAAGFDALIANPFIGWDEGLEPIFDVAESLHRGVILLVYMSHKAAREGYGQTVFDPETGEKVPQYLLFAKKALLYNADGVVVGATYPQRIAEVYKILDGKVPIYSPGIGTQGGTLAPALEAGTRYLIVGRKITLAEKPAVAAREIRNLAKAIR